MTAPTSTSVGKCTNRYSRENPTRAAMRKECEGRGETFIYNATSRGKLKNSLNMDAGKVKQLLEAGVQDRKSVV